MSASLRTTPSAGLQRVAAQGAGQADADHVGGLQQIRARAFVRPGVGVVDQAIDKALALDHRLARIAGTAAAHGVAGAVAEGADAAAVQGQLRGLHEARAVFHLAEIPAFADQLHAAAGGLVHAACRRSIAARGWWPIRSKRKESMR
jgi:hypothetical protein